jgi:hypothetical protein
MLVSHQGAKCCSESVVAFINSAGNKVLNMNHDSNCERKGTAGGGEEDRGGPYASRRNSESGHRGSRGGTKKPADTRGQRRAVEKQMGRRELTFGCLEPGSLWPASRSPPSPEHQMASQQAQPPSEAFRASPAPRGPPPRRPQRTRHMNARA